MNPLELFQDPTVTDVLVDSTKSIQVVREGKLQTIGEYFSDDLELQNFAKQQIRNANGRIDLAKPFAEVNIAGEFGQLRFHAILAGQCSFGTQVSIRRHPVKQLSLEDLFTLRTIDNSQLQKLKEIITLRSNFVIIGATGSGKTTLLRAMLNSVSYQRIITIEDSQELKVINAIELYARPKNADGYGEISLDMLVREALRMRPDRLVIGEARGKELATVLQALNTGHNGVGFTLHANGSTQAITRMLGLLALSGLEPSIARATISSAIDVVIELNSENRTINSIEKLVI
ncbi:MAG: CpaF family protein [Rhodoluna sp.]